MKTISTLSIIHIFFRLGINFLKIRSETKAITAVSRQNPTKRAVKLTWLLYSAGVFFSSSHAANTTHMEDTMFKGVNFTFNSFVLLKITF
uniref:hypothetical protein n=1 Tax=Pedobacter schmidteae TaxID=2201271 RepID=UPI000EB503A4|nr:hypothetical protein [Pedobacter schmidteae]